MRHYVSYANNSSNMHMRISIHGMKKEYVFSGIWKGENYLVFSKNPMMCWYEYLRRWDVISGCSNEDELARLRWLAQIGGISPSLRNSYNT